LRQALERYYLGIGKNDPLRIEIPMGTYVPNFHVQDRVKSESKSGKEGESDSKQFSRWPTILIRPFENLTADPDLNYLTVGFATELAVELSRYQDIKVLKQPPAETGKMIPKRMTRYTIEGNIRKHAKGLKVFVQLVDMITGEQLWARSHYSLFDAPDITFFEEETARVVAAHIASEHGVIALNLSGETRNKPPSELEAYEAILKYYEFDLHFTADTYLRALEALERAVEIEPDCGQVCTMLGRLYAVNYSLELFSQTNLLEDAITYAEKGVQLNPESQRARTILVLCRLLSNEIKAALAEAEKSLALNPHSLVFLEEVGFQMILCGAYDRGVAIIKKAISGNPYHSLQAHAGLCVDWFRRGEYEQAYLETLNFRRPSHFWKPLAQAATLGLLGRKHQGQRVLRRVFYLKPDFRERGLVLMKHILKFDEILDPFLSGLRKVGLNFNQPH
jgi:TolB-like protein